VRSPIRSSRRLRRRTATPTGNWRTYSTYSPPSIRPGSCDGAVKYRSPHEAHCAVWRNDTSDGSGCSDTVTVSNRPPPHRMHRAGDRSDGGTVMNSSNPKAGMARRLDWSAEDRAPDCARSPRTHQCWNCARRVYAPRRRKAPGAVPRAFLRKGMSIRRWRITQEDSRFDQSQCWGRLMALPSLTRPVTVCRRRIMTPRMPLGQRLRVLG
jgi:hypothetical protein